MTAKPKSRNETYHETICLLEFATDMIDEGPLEARPNIALLYRTEIVALTGTPEGRLERVRWRHAQTGAETERATRAGQYQGGGHQGLSRRSSGQTFLDFFAAC